MNGKQGIFSKENDLWGSFSQRGGKKWKIETNERVRGRKSVKRGRKRGKGGRKKREKGKKKREKGKKKREKENKKSEKGNKMGRICQRREEIGKKGGKVKKWVL